MMRRSSWNKQVEAASKEAVQPRKPVGFQSGSNGQTLWKNKQSCSFADPNCLRIVEDVSRPLN